MFLRELGRRLRERREQLRLTQGDIANALQVSPQAVSKWERGDNAPDIIGLPALAQLLGTTTDFLLGNHDARQEEFEATIFVSSILGFSARCEALRPTEIALWSNGFFRQVTEAVLAQGGVPIKYLGDGFLACFAGSDHTARATDAAVTAREVVSERLVVSLAAGPAHLTAIGHGDYARPDILGPVVNRAFRLNAWTAENAPARIAVAGDRQALEARFELGQSVEVTLKGSAEPQQIAEVLRRVPRV